MRLFSFKKRFSIPGALARLCQNSARVRLRAVAGETCGATIQTRFLALEPDRLWLYWPNGAPFELMERGVQIEAYFEHESERCAFRAQTLGRAARVFSPETRIDALVITLPVRIERKQQRDAYRVSLIDLDRISAMIHVPGAKYRAFEVCLLNISLGGFSGVMERSAARAVERGKRYRTEFKLPGVEQPFALDIELVHERDLEHDAERVQTGWRFHPDENPLVAREAQRRIESFIAARQIAQLRRLR